MCRLKVLRAPCGAAATRHDRAVGLEAVPRGAKHSWRPQILYVAAQQGLWLISEIDGSGGKLSAFVFLV